MELKLVIVVIVGIAQVANLTPLTPRNSEEMVCTPGTTFKIECNTCFCSESGMNFGCTKMGCVNRNIGVDDSTNDINQGYHYKKREIQHFRKKRAADNIYTDDHQFFVEDPAPVSFEQQQELARQSYIQQQQDYYDRIQLQQDLAREQADLAEQQSELEEQNEEMLSQLEFQQDQDAQQWEEDARQMALERQQQLIEQQQQKKQDEQYYKQYTRNRGFRKGSLRKH